MIKIICPNCGAPIDLTKDKCPYCETPYHEKQEGITINYDYAHINLDVINVLFRSGAISLNEARKFAGLPPIE